MVFNKDKIILFNVQNFNQQLEWKNIAKVEYGEKNQVMIYMEQLQNKSPVRIDLQYLNQDSMDKAKILIAYKIRQSQKPLAGIKKPLDKKNNKHLAKENENTQ